MNRLAVVGEVSLRDDGRGTRNRSLNEILIEYRKHFEEVHYIGPGKSLRTRERGKESGVVYSTVTGYAKPLRSRLHFLGQLGQARARINELLRSEQRSIVQLRIPGVFPILLYPAVRRLGCPLTTYVAGDWESSFASNYLFPGSRLLGGLLDFAQKGIIRTSVPVTAGPELARKYGAIRSCHAYFSTTHRHTVPNKSASPVELLYVGRLEPLKRVEDAIDAVPIIAREFPDVKLRIVGEGVSRGELESRAKRKRVRAQVLFEGYVDNDERLRDLYCRSSMLILPSLSEGTPKVLAEAMAHGSVPIGVRGVGSIEHIIEDGKNGRLVGGRSPEGIAETVLELAKNIGYLAQLREEGYRYARDHTLQKEVERMWAYVHRCLK